MKCRLLSLIMTFFMIGIAHAQNAVHIAEQHDRQASSHETRSELDNEAVQVLRIHLGPHQKIPMHDVTPRVVVWLTDAHVRATFADGTTREELGKPGQVEWVPTQRHAAENLDDHPVEFLAVIPKAIGSTTRNSK